VSIAIELPQLNQSFLDVWGVDDEIEIECLLLNKQGQPIPGQIVQVWVEDKKVGDLATNNEGSGRLTHTFKNRGQFKISCRFEGDWTYKACSQTRMIKFVDYREEAVNLFNSLLKYARRRGIRIAKEATPREIEQILQMSFKDIDSNKLDAFIGYFEKSLYSSHPFGRDCYETMFSIQKLLREFIEGA